MNKEELGALKRFTLKKVELKRNVLPEDMSNEDTEILTEITHKYSVQTIKRNMKALIIEMRKNNEV